MKKKGGEGGVIPPMLERESGHSLSPLSRSSNKTVKAMKAAMKAMTRSSSTEHGACSWKITSESIG